MKNERRIVLEQLRDFLWMYGTANDAQDHDCAGEATQLTRRASAGISKLMDEHSFIPGVFPDLCAEMESGRIETWTWSNLVDTVEKELGN